MFEKNSSVSHIRLIASSTSSKLGIIRKALCLFGDLVLETMCFWSFLLPVLQCCSSVWMSAAAFPLCLLDRVVPKAVRLIDGLVVPELEHRSRVSSLITFYMNNCNPNHALGAHLSEFVYMSGRPVKLLKKRRSIIEI